MQRIVFFPRFIQKGMFCIIDGILKLLSLLKGVCDLTNSITPSFLYVISSLVIHLVNGGPLGNDSFKCVSAIHKLSIFPPTIYLDNKT